MNDIKETAVLLIQNICLSLQELHSSSLTEFTVGQIYAYTECLEILQLCPVLQKDYIDYCIEQKFPLPCGPLRPTENIPDNEGSSASLVLVHIP